MKMSEVKWEWRPEWKFFTSCDEYLHRVYFAPMGIGRLRITSNNYCGMCLGFHLEQAENEYYFYYQSVIRMIKMHAKGIYLTRKNK